MCAPDADREQLLAVFDANRHLLSSIERWIDYIAPVGQASGANVIPSANNLRINDAYMATFWQVRFAIECGYTLLDNLDLPPAPAELRQGSDWMLYQLHYDRPDSRAAERLLGGWIKLRDAYPLPEWLAPAQDGFDVVIDLQATVGWLMSIIGDRREPGIIARWWQTVDRNFTSGPACTDFDASWCPNCGDCTCDRSTPEFSLGQIGDYYGTDYDRLGKSGCPLHERSVTVRHRGATR